jgi:hypothetical protein
VFENVFFSPAHDPHVDLAILRGCDGLVIGPSTLGWWAAYLAHLPGGGLVVAPRHIFNAALPPTHALLKGFSQLDYYPPSWLLLDNTGKGSPKPSGPVPDLLLECQLRLTGDCSGHSDPRYRRWFTVHQGPASTVRQGCRLRQTAWRVKCTSRRVAVEMRLQPPAVPHPSTSARSVRLTPPQRGRKSAPASPRQAG